MTLVTNIDRSIEIEAAVTLAERMDWLDDVATHAPSALAVATKLAHRWIDKKLGGFTIGQETVAEKNGIPLRSVQRQMATLKAAGLLIQKRRYHKCPVTFLVLDRQSPAGLEPEINPPSVAGSPESQPAKYEAVNPPNLEQSTRQPQIGNAEKSEACEIVSRDIIPVKKNPSARAARSVAGVTNAARENFPPPAAAAQRKAFDELERRQRRPDDWSNPPPRRKTIDTWEAEIAENKARRAGGSSGLGWEPEPLLPRCAGRKIIPVPRPIASNRIREETIARLMALPRRHAEEQEPVTFRDKLHDRLADREEVGRRCGRVEGFELDETVLADWPDAEREAWMRGWHEGRAEKATGAGASP